MSALTFRRAVSSDIAAMSALRLVVKENVLSNPGLVTEAMYEEYLERLGRGWVCELDAELIGFSFAARADGSIWALFVRPDREGLGAGKTLLSLAVEWLFSLGHATVKLSTQANTRADRFYAAQGWTRGPMKDVVEVTFSLPRAR